MQLVIFAGGLGSRLGNNFNLPKPLIQIGKIPIILHIINYYNNYKLKEVIICGGYKFNELKKYFLNDKFKNTQIFKSKSKIIFYSKRLKIKFFLINTGINTNTAGRLKKVSKYLRDVFHLTYADGLSNININKNIALFKKFKNQDILLTAVQPPGRFGHIEIKNNKVISFNEKPKGDNGWINGGFFICKKNVLKYIKNLNESWEDILKKVTKRKKVLSIKHKGFWQCMDTQRDVNLLNQLMKKNKGKW